MNEGTLGYLILGVLRRAGRPLDAGDILREIWRMGVPLEDEPPKSTPRRRLKLYRGGRKGS